jgi:ribosomal protein L7/L12
MNMSLLDLLNEANDLKEKAKLSVIRSIANGDWQHAMCALREAEQELVEKQMVNAEPLSGVEFALMRENLLPKAIMEYRNRTNSSLMLAKKVVENARDIYKKK